MQKIISFSNNSSLYCAIKKDRIAFDISDNISVYIFGDIFYNISGKGGIDIFDKNSTGRLKRLFSAKKLAEIVPELEGQYFGLLVDKQKKSVTAFCDRYARLDIFYAEVNGNFYFSTDLEEIFKYARPVYDQKMLANLFAVYGWYTPRGLTIYKNVRRLKVGEILIMSPEGLKSEEIDFVPLSIADYCEKDLENYYSFLKESIVARADRKGINWVSSSSGWDSSIILGILVDEFGADKVRMISGSMKYSKETDVINAFEINKIKKIGAFYGIKPDIVDFNFKDKSAGDYWRKVLPVYKSRHTYAFSTFNFSKLSDGLVDAQGRGRTVFNGETSDSFHNFGFSQFVTFFHTVKSFTEYGDKMNCYLYGPSFLKKVFNGSYKKDKVYQIFTRMLNSAEFIDAPQKREDLLQAYLYPLFYGAPRIPFAKTQTNPLFNKKGIKAVYDFPFKEYIPEVLSGMNEENIYSWLIYLYLNFHSQGSTVAMHKHSMEANDHYWRAPFNDYRMIELLSRAPESWGRGLDFNNTKYPLKWTAKNKIRFPYDLLQEGPHSYLYDVLEGFSLLAEVTYRSGVTGLLKDSVNGKPYRRVLQDEYFDLEYLDNLAEDFLNNKPAWGIDFNNLVSLLTFSVTGWY